MLPDFRFVIGAVLAIAVLGTTAFGMLVAMRATHQTKAGPLEVSRNLAFDDRADWNQFYDPDSGRRFEELARRSDAPPARPPHAPEPAAAERSAEPAVPVAPAEPVRPVEASVARVPRDDVPPSASAEIATSPAATPSTGQPAPAAIAIAAPSAPEAPASLAIESTHPAATPANKPAADSPPVAS